MPRFKLNAIAVHHTTRVGAVKLNLDTPHANYWLERPTSDLQSLTTKFRGLKRRVKRMGFERTCTDPASWDNYGKYWQEAEESARKHGIEVEALEKEKGDNEFQALHVIVQGAWRTGEHNPVTFYQRFENLLGDLKSQFDFDTPKLERLVNEVIQKIPGELNAESLAKLENALNVHRSIRMYESAKARNLTHAVMGVYHTEDLRVLNLARITHVGEAKPQPRKTVEQRIADYHELKDFVDHLHQIASS